MRTCGSVLSQGIGWLGLESWDAHACGMLCFTAANKEIIVSLVCCHRQRRVLCGEVD